MKSTFRTRKLLPHKVIKSSKLWPMVDVAKSMKILTSEVACVGEVKG